MKDQEYFSQFSNEINEEFNQAVAESESKSNNSDFKRLDDGKYEVKVENMEIKKSKKGEWMLEVTFKVVAGKCKNRKAWAYYMLRPNLLYIAKKFLNQLESGIDVKYESELQFAKMVDEILTTITNDRKEYGLEITTNEKGFTNYKILKVLDPLPEEIPFN